MIINNKTYVLLLIIDFILLTLGIINQDIYYNNYSYYESFTSGYLYLLLIAIISSILMAYVSNYLSNKKVAYIAFFSFIIATIIPSTIDQSTILANIHLIFAYIGFSLSMFFTIINLYFFQIYDSKKSKIFIFLFFIILVLSLYFYLDKMMINFISEYIYTSGILLQNSIIYLYKKGVELK